MADQNYIQIQAEVEIPTIPNFIRLSNGQSISIADMSDKSLKEIGEKWTEELIKKAQSKRGLL